MKKYAIATVTSMGLRITPQDRIGGGDGFSGGLLYGVLKEWTPSRKYT